MAGPMEIVWRSDALASTEHCTISDVPGPSSIVGRAELPLHDQPAVVTYSIDSTSNWLTSRARVNILAGTDSQTIELRRDSTGWVGDGAKRPELDECTTVDLGWSPATNTLALRSTPLALGESATSVAAWLRFPELDVVASTQTYTRIRSDLVRYE